MNPLRGNAQAYRSRNFQSGIESAERSGDLQLRYL